MVDGSLFNKELAEYYAQPWAAKAGKVDNGETMEDKGEKAINCIITSIKGLIYKRIYGG